jgi:glycosyltransferase involved in cell wall biosynthesis
VIPEPGARPRVAVFRANLLPVSETFIRDQLGALRDWEAVLLGMREVPAGLMPLAIPSRLVPRGNRLLFSLRALLARPQPRLVAAFRQSRAALVHAHFGTDATAIWPSVKAAGLPLVVTLHGYDINTRREWWESGKGGFKRRFYPRQLLQMAGDPAVHFVAVSQAIRQRAIEYGIPDHRITVCHIGIDTERFRPAGAPLASRRKRLLFVGRMVEKKAPLLLVRAFAGVRQRVPDAELVMIGKGPLLDAAQQLAGKLQVPVEFAGARGSDQVLEELHQARVLCLPSITAHNGDAEGFGMVILEAQACGVPVVTSARGGASEGLIPGETGDAVPEGDLGQLTERLVAWLADEDLLRHAAMAAPQFVRDAFDIRHCTRQLELVYERCVAAASRTA